MKPLNSTSPDSETAAQASRGKPIPCTDLQYTTAEFTLPALGGYALRCLMPTRATMAPTYPVPVRRLVPLLHASFKPRLATTPLRFATLHLHQVGRGTFTLLVSRHARHTCKKRRHARRAEGRDARYSKIVFVHWSCQSTSQMSLGPLANIQARCLSRKNEQSRHYRWRN